MGCDIVRVGFEDNIYLPEERPARHNHELVAVMARIANDLGREVATWRRREPFSAWSGRQDNARPLPRC
jgi:uncharacterized protein (DUF849 family)